MDTFADLYSAIPASICRKGGHPVRATLGLYWVNTRPAELVVTVRAGEDYEAWVVGRSLFTAAHEEWARGSWLGAGHFSVCYAGDKAMLGFRPPRHPGSVLIAEARPVASFIEHSCALVPQGVPESQVTLKAVDEALRRIFRAQL